MALVAVAAEGGDFDFLRKEIFLCVRKKHFDFPIKDAAGRQCLEDNIRSAIDRHCFLSGLGARPLLFVHSRRRVGLVVMTEVSPGRGGNEIHLFAVGHKHQGKGYGSQMLDSILAPRRVVDVYTRCAPASQIMYEMLERRGFVYKYTMEDGMRVLCRPGQAGLA